MAVFNGFVEVRPIVSFLVCVTIFGSVPVTISRDERIEVALCVPIKVFAVKFAGESDAEREPDSGGDITDADDEAVETLEDAGLSHLPEDEQAQARSVSEISPQCVRGIWVRSAQLSTEANLFQVHVRCSPSRITHALSHAKSSRGI